MSQESQVTPPPVMWAQRNVHLFVTICLEDCKDPEIKVESEQIYFKGVGGTEQKEHEITINLFKPIDPTKTIQNAKGRLFELVLSKKQEGPYWPRLTKENNKFHWLKCDFNKWKDEDDSENESEEGGQPRDFENVIRNMGYLSGSGDDKPNFPDLGNIDEDAEFPDSDDDDLPDLE